MDIDRKACIPNGKIHSNIFCFRYICNESHSKLQSLKSKEIEREIIFSFVDNVTAYLLFSNQHEVRRMGIKSKVTVSLLSGLRSTIALDFHYEKNMIFWSDVVDEVIYSGQLESDCKLISFDPFEYLFL